MSSIQIVKLSEENLEELIYFCIPKERRKEEVFKKGQELKKEYMHYYLDKFKTGVKLAYIDKKLVGMIQYLPKPNELIIEIQCIFVPNETNQQKGIGKRLLQAVIEEMKEPKEYFNNQKPLALVTFAFQVPELYPQHIFYSKMGFQKIHEKNPYYLYYPLKKGYIYGSKVSESKFEALPKDKGKAIIIIDPFCPFCFFFAKDCERVIRTVKEDIKVDYINSFSQKKELEKRGGIVPSYIVNQKPIHAFYKEEEAFIKEVENALNPKS